MMFGAKTVLDICTNAMKKVTTQHTPVTPTSAMPTPVIPTPVVHSTTASVTPVKQTQASVELNGMVNGTSKEQHIDPSVHMKEAYKYVKNTRDTLYIRFIMTNGKSIYFKLFENLNNQEINDIKFYLALLSSLGMHYRPDITHDNTRLIVESADIKYWTTILNHTLNRKEKITLSTEHTGDNYSSSDIQHCYFVCCPSHSSMIHFDINIHYR